MQLGRSWQQIHIFRSRTSRLQCSMLGMHRLRNMQRTFYNQFGMAALLDFRGSASQSSYLVCHDILATQCELGRGYGTMRQQSANMRIKADFQDVSPQAPARWTETKSRVTNRLGSNILCVSGANPLQTKPHKKARDWPSDSTGQESAVDLNSGFTFSDPSGKLLR